MGELIAQSDVVTLHAPPLTVGYLLGAEELGTMKKGAIVVNTSRGALVDTKALIEGLGHGHPGFAALDVFESEPPDVAIFEKVADQLTLTPHMSWYTEESELALRRQAATEALRILTDEAPVHHVVAPTAEGAGRR
jgi:D-3-phosphoglycerate dehydrogenase